MTLIAGAPNTPAGPTVEALNAIFDIYADAEFDYDEPVFVKNGFLAHLSKALPNARTMVSALHGYAVGKYHSLMIVWVLTILCHYVGQED